MLYAILCEGTAEEEIIKILLDNDLLSFTREEMLMKKPLRIRKANKFAQEYLSHELPEKVSIYRVIDSINESFKINKVYAKKYDKVVKILTRPEIEMLIILRENLLVDFNKYSKKPSDYLKTIDKFKGQNIKSREFVNNYWSTNNGNDLLDAIKLYKSKHQKSNELSIFDLLK